MPHRSPDQRAATVFRRLEAEVIRPGLCTHCGTCVGLAPDRLTMAPSRRGPLPIALLGKEGEIPPLALEACPGKQIRYPDLYRFLFGTVPENWLIGCYRRLFVGYSRVPSIRAEAASGGVITQTLLYLLEQGLIDGAVVVRQGHPRPWEATPIIACSVEEIRAASQSVYAPVPVNTLLAQMEAFPGRLAYVGLPDQVASLRRLQQLGHPGAQKVAYVLGPYVGTNMYQAAIESYLRSHAISSLHEITELRYREGTWPGYLQIKTRSGRVLRAEKFYYNYLIPFYITQSSLFAVDFTNELTDISVGDAWHPRYERQGGGFSVVVARSQLGEQVLATMRERGLIELEPLSLDEALSMHGHMLDFKKRGSFIRLGWRRQMGKPVPDYGYHPKAIPLSRILTEIVISVLFAMCGTYPAQRIVECIPLDVLGPLFNGLRISWKNASKPIKRKGLRSVEFIDDSDANQR